MPTLLEQLLEAERRLRSVTDTPRLDAELLLAHALGWSRSRLLGRLREAAPAAGFETLVARRLAYEPIAYITGVWEFFSLEFAVRPPVLVPRPETEHLVEAVLEYAGGRPLRMLDLCTGSGCVAVALARNAPGSTIVATDAHPAAVALTRENAARHGVAIDVREGDLFSALPDAGNVFDVIVSNPPYVEEGCWTALSPVITRHEDPAALLAGPDGLAVIRRIVAGAARCLRPGGLLALEMGESQSSEVCNLMKNNGFEQVKTRPDLAGIARIAEGLRAECRVQ